MKIIHNYHSGIIIEYEKVVLMFDVYTEMPKFEGKKIYCFVTHSHGDHYSPDILQLKDKNEVVYIYSEDVPLVDGYKVNKGDHLNVDDLNIDVFGTTDLGVSFKVVYRGKVFFHSGDLNWWHWPSNSKDKQEIEAEDYKKELEFLKGPIDFAFVPVDPRLQDGMLYSMNYFIDKYKPKYLIPIHFAEAYAVIENVSTKYETKLLISTKHNDIIYKHS